jgi:hypothetical protein
MLKSTSLGLFQARNGFRIPGARNGFCSIADCFSGIAALNKEASRFSFQVQERVQFPSWFPAAGCLASVFGRK